MSGVGAGCSKMMSYPTRISIRVLSIDVEKSLIGAVHAIAYRLFGKGAVCLFLLLNRLRDYPEEVLMIVTFRSKAHADIMMFGDIAISLLKLMGHTGAVPGALLAADVPKALDHLTRAVSVHKTADAGTPEHAPAQEDEPSERPVHLAHRALPLMELLADSIKAKCDVMWDK